MGGEKYKVYVYNTVDKGSPPHGRGKVDVLPEVHALIGITPAWAGKRHSLEISSTTPKDHPRMGGEKLFDNGTGQGAQGSPPRRRGKDDVFRGQILLPGITPAWAGKRAVFR